MNSKYSSSPIKIKFCVIKFIQFLSICLFTTHNLMSQNLVPNSSFETINNCPNNDGQLYYASPWVSTRGTCDLFNSCSSGNFDLPTNVNGYQNAHSGNSFGGFFALQGYVEIREYLQVRLLDTLTAGETYCVSFYLSLADKLDDWNELIFDVAVNNIGAYFSPNSFPQEPNNFIHYSVTPQVANDPSLQLLSDTMNWMLVEGQFVANGDELYMTIGSFNDNAGQDTTALDIWQFSLISYYFIDDIKVTSCSCSSLELNTNMIGVLCHNDNNAIINTNAIGGVAPYTYSLSQNSGSTIIGSQNGYTDTISFVDLSPGIYNISVLDSNQCDFDTTITISNPPAFLVNAVLESDSCDTHSGSISINGGQSNLYTYSWNPNVGSTNTVSDLTQGTYQLTISDSNNCSMDTAFVIVGTHSPSASFTVNPGTTVEIGTTVVFTDTSIPENGTTITNWLWTFSGSNQTGFSIATNTFQDIGQETVQLQVTGSNGCTSIISEIITISSELIIPNIITMNGDNLNDIFFIGGVSAYKSISILITNRWGNVIYQNNDYKNTWMPSDIDDGVYFYIVEGVKNSGEKDEKQGFFHILK